MYVRHIRENWCCPYEVWEGRTFIGAYQTLWEAMARINRGPLETTNH